MNSQPPPLPEPDQIRAIAREYALECQRRSVKPTLQGVATRLQRHHRWLKPGHTVASTVTRAIILKQWREMGVSLTASQIEPEPKPASKATPEPQPAPQPDPEPEAMPTEYLSGDALLDVLSHPGRLEQFCRLMDSLGPAGAFRYAQMVRDFNPAKHRVSKPHDEVA